MITQNQIRKLNPLYNPSKNDKSQIMINGSKEKVFYFKSGESDALIKCFRDTISKNKSEFRHMPEDEHVFQKDDYSEIYDLKNAASINKLRGIEGISIDKYNLSKLLGKYLRIGGLVRDNKERGIVKHINKIFDINTLIDNYTTWEKIIQIFYINGFHNELERFVEKIVSAIGKLKGDGYIEDLKDSLYLHLVSSLARPMALLWGSDNFKLIERIISIIFDNNESENLLSLRNMYLRTRMIDKTMLPILIDCLSLEDISDEQEIDLTDFSCVVELFHCTNSNLKQYKYYPYIVSSYVQWSKVHM